VASRASSAKRIASKDEVQSCLVAAWGRTIAQNGGKKATFAESIGVHPDTVSNALSGTTVPELHTVLNSLVACPNALDEVMRLYGFILVPEDKAMSPDMQTLVEMSQALARFCEAMEDGRRDHRETIELANKLRPLLPKLHSIVDEADTTKLRSVA
jgi:DNA-binding phage protein